MTSYSDPSTSLTFSVNFQKIPILKGRENYVDWADAIKRVMDSVQAWPIIQGIFPEPTVPEYLYKALLRPKKLISAYRVQHKI